MPLPSCNFYHKYIQTKKIIKNSLKRELNRQLKSVAGVYISSQFTQWYHKTAEKRTKSQRHPKVFPNGPPIHCSTNRPLRRLTSEFETHRHIFIFSFFFHPPFFFIFNFLRGGNTTRAINIAIPFHLLPLSFFKSIRALALWLPSRGEYYVARSLSRFVHFLVSRKFPRFPSPKCYEIHWVNVKKKRRICPQNSKYLNLPEVFPTFAIDQWRVLQAAQTWRCQCAWSFWSCSFLFAWRIPK